MDNINEQLRKAAMCGDLERVKNLVEVGAKIYSKNYAALRWAAFRGHVKVVKYLVENGADVYSNDNNAFRWAARGGHINVVLYIRNITGDRWKCHDCLVKPMCLNLCDGIFKNHKIKGN